MFDFKKRLLKNETLKKIGDKYDKTVAQVCLKWGIQKGFVVIPKSITPSRIFENIQVNFFLNIKPFF